MEISSPSRNAFNENAMFEQMTFNNNSSEIIVDKSDIEYPHRSHYSSSKENNSSYGNRCDDSSIVTKSSSSSHNKRSFVIPNSHLTTTATIKSSHCSEYSEDSSIEKKIGSKYKYKDAKSSIELCEFFQVNSFDVFDGGKKSNNNLFLSIRNDEETI